MSIIINGREYPLWSQFVEKATEWVGGELQDFGDSMDRAMGLTDDTPTTTSIKGFELAPNGKTSAMFHVLGNDFDCGFDVGHGGICAGEKGWLTFSCYGGQTFRIRKPTNPTPAP